MTAPRWASTFRVWLPAMLVGLPVVAPAAQSVTESQLDSIIRKTVAEKHIIGLSVGVMQKGRVILAKGYGLRDMATRDSVTPATMFGIGSITKQFTCASVMMLAEQHKLALTDRVAKYFPNLTRAGDISLIDVAGHAAGYRDYYPLDFVDREMAKSETPDEIIRRYATLPLDFEPRSRWSYSNTGYLILGRVVEKASGQPFGDFLSSRIFTPLGMTHTAYEPEQGSGLARGYTAFGVSDPIPATQEARGWAGMAGAIYSTPTDLLAWDRSLLDHKLISKKSYDVMTTAQRLSDGRSSGYGCGESVDDRGAAVVISHGGAVSGFVAQNTVVPATRSAVVLLTNSDLSPIGPLNQELVNLVMPRGADIPMVAGLGALDAAKKFLTDLAQGTVDRSTLGEDFSIYLTAEKVADAMKTMRALGRVSNVRLGGSAERGGMEVVGVAFDIGTTPARGVMYRTPDGKIQEFLFSKS